MNSRIVAVGNMGMALEYLAIAAVCERLRSVKTHLLIRFLLVAIFFVCLTLPLCGCVKRGHYDFLYFFEVKGTLNCGLECNSLGFARLTVKNVVDKSIKPGFVIGESKISKTGDFMIKGNLWEGRDSPDAPSPNLEIFEMSIEHQQCVIKRELKLTDFFLRSSDQTYTYTINPSEIKC